MRTLLEIWTRYYLMYNKERLNLCSQRKHIAYPELQIRGGIEDNSKIIFLISH